MGFEPMVRCRITSFQDWLLKPLGHLSILYARFSLAVAYSIPCFIGGKKMDTMDIDDFIFGEEEKSSSER